MIKFGNIHSIETMGTVDGPGIRFVIFLQGCPLRCLYCHNPDTWSIGENKLMSVDEILLQYESVKEFTRSGGITVTGGEPLLQIDFVIELFKKAKEKNIHNAIDTSGILFNAENIQKYNELMKYTDLVLLDIKHIDDEKHKILTGQSNKNVLAFARYLSDIKKPIWLRHVIVEGYTNDKTDLERLGEFLKTLKNIKALDILPYHNLAIEKYKNLGIDYKLKNVPAMTKNQAILARDIILSQMDFSNSYL